MKLLFRKGLSLGIVVMLVIITFAGVSLNAGAKKNTSDEVKPDTQAVSNEDPEEPYGPEAVITFDPETRQIEVYGEDEHDNYVEVVQTVLQEAKREKTVLYTLTNDAGETLELTLKFKYSKNKEGKIEVTILEPGDVPGKPAEFKDPSFNIDYKVDKRTGEINKLTQTIIVNNHFKSKADYQSSRDETRIEYSESGRRLISEELGGLALFNLKTDNGGYTLSLMVDGVEERMEELLRGDFRITPAQLVAYEELQINSAKPCQVRFGDLSGVPEYISGSWESDPDVASPGDNALDFIDTYSALFRLDPRTDSHSVVSVSSSRLGLTNVKLQQEYNDIPVFGAEFIVHLDRSGDIVYMNGNFVPGIDIGTTSRISAEEAQRYAKLDLLAKDSRILFSSISTPELSVYDTTVLNRYSESTSTLTWFMIIKTKNPVGIWYYFVNTEDGSIVEAWDNYKGESSSMPWSTLLYQREPGAINEAFNILFKDTSDTRTAFVSPRWDGDFDHMDYFQVYESRYDPANTNYGVSENSAIITKLILLMAYGGAHYGTDIEPLGVYKTKEVLMATFRDSGLCSSSSIKEFRDVMCETSDDMKDGGLAGINSSNCNAINSAWGVIGVKKISQTLFGETIGNYDRFGWSLAKGDFNNDSFEDLAVGVPYEDTDEINDGAVTIFYGTIDGLSKTDTEKLTQTMAGLTNEEYDKFGWSLASGDFDGDGFDDLAVGIPHKNWAGKSDSGLVVVFYGTTGGLIPKPTGFPPTKVPPITDIIQQTFAGPSHGNGDKFGWALTVGDFNNDSIDDLAVGVPYKNIVYSNSGAVLVYYGNEGYGLVPDSIFFPPLAGAEYIFELHAGIINQPHDHFGYALASGDFNNDSFDDLAVGIPGMDWFSKYSNGRVAIIYGSEYGLLPVVDRELLGQNLADVDAEDGDRFGWSLAAGDLNGDSFDDLAVGIPHKDYNIKDDGLVIIFYSVGEDGLLTGTLSGPIIFVNANTSLFQQRTAGASNEYEDKFGWRLTIANFDGDSYDDLAVGVPYEDYAGKLNNGVVDVLYGSNVSGKARMGSWRSYWLAQSYFGGVEQGQDKFGYSLVGGDFNGDGKDELAVGAPWEDFYDIIKNCGAVYVRTLEPALPWVNATAAIVYSEDYNCVMGIKKPDERLDIASTTKIMTALLAIERTLLPEDHEDYLNLSDNLTVGPEGNFKPGSYMRGNLTTGDVLTLENLLYGLMLPSGNDASVVIAEHISGPNSWDDGAFCDLMNTRAAELGMTNTQFKNSWGTTTPGHYSTTRDLAKLTVAAFNYQLFKDIVGTTSIWTSDWIDANGTAKTAKQVNTNKLLYNATYKYNGCTGVKTGTTTAAGQCLVSSATRGDENIIAVVLHSATYYGGPPNRYTDSHILLDYGFEADYP
ncbi:MAG: FG-GAP repeat protein [Thermoplasmata archaeon]|nr:MAG: FG-GAP repeat protein [Thermoplasmata archaeon]